MHDKSGGENAILVHVNVSATLSQEDITEFELLASSAGARLSFFLIANCKQPTAKYFIGSGKAQEIADIAKAHPVTLILVNHALSASQERNLEQLTGRRVVDRTRLILDIFAKRARTFEGKLQVELAQLQHLSTRLIRGWTHLERQKGGIGLRGPGETQLETDRRLIRGRIKVLEKRLEKVQTQRDQNRYARKRNAIPVVSLVGYTNAGKSTLFNRLTHASVYVADKLFATLDPTLRRIKLLSQRTIILADTVGFIRHLPHDLIAAFKATLTETREADLLLHVIDISHASRQDNNEAVNVVLNEIGAGKVKKIEIYNKIDLVDACKPFLIRDNTGFPTKIALSAHTGEGIDLLRKMLVEIFP